MSFSLLQANSNSIPLCEINDCIENKNNNENLSLEYYYQKYQTSEKNDFENNAIIKNLNAFMEQTAKYISLNDSEENERPDLGGLEIISNMQSKIGDVFYAEGDVIIKKNNIILRADKLSYDLSSKVFQINGNIYLVANDQFLEASEVIYNLNIKSGYLKEVYGSINFDTLADIKLDNDSEANISEKVLDNKKINKVFLNESSNLKLDNINLKRENGNFLKKISSQKLNVDLNKMQQWRFQTEKIEIQNEVWKSDFLILTNDPFNKPQLVINNSGFRTSNDNGEIIVKSKWSSVVLDDFLKIPVGPRRYKLNSENRYKWDIGYDKNSKDGLFISRNFDRIYFGDNKTTLDLKKYFFIQRSLFGKTNVFSNKNDVVLGTKVEQDAKLLDYLGLGANLNSKFFGFDFNSNIEFNSLDFEKFKKIISVKSNLSKILYEENKNDMQKKTTLYFYGTYRDKVWNGSLGEIDILGAYGSVIEKKNNWIDNNINKSSTIALGYGNFKSGKRLESTKVIDRQRLNLFLERNHTYPIWEKSKEKYINNKFRYTPKVIREGLFINMQTKADFYRYSDNNFQNLLTFRLGPEITLGNLKRKYLDYSQLSIYPKVTYAKGESPFDFDQAVDNHLIEINYKQHLFGPIIAKISTEYNLDINSKKYKELSNFKYEIGWNRRAYNLSAYYNQDAKTGGISFKIHSFNFNGIGERFKTK